MADLASMGETALMDCLDFLVHRDQRDILDEAATP